MLERHKSEREGKLKRPTKTELTKGQRKVSFENYHKHMKSPFVIYVDFEWLYVEKEPGLRAVTRQKLHRENKEA